MGVALIKLLGYGKQRNIKDFYFKGSLMNNKFTLPYLSNKFIDEGSSDKVIGLQ